MKFKFLTSMLLAVTMMFSTTSALAYSYYSDYDLSIAEISVEEEAYANVDSYLPEVYYPDEAATPEVPVLETKELDEFISEDNQEEVLVDETYLPDEFNLFEPTFIDIAPTTIMPSGQVTITPEVFFAWDEVYVTLTYMTTTATPRRLTITLPYGGEFLVDSEEDVTFRAGPNGIVQNTAGVDFAGDAMIVTTHNNAIFQQNTITFRMEVPLFATAIRVDVVADIGFFQPPNATPFVFPIGSSLTIETIYRQIPGTHDVEEDVIDDVTPFVISGDALFRGQNAPSGSFVFVEIVRLRADGTAYEMPCSVHMVPVVNGRYYQEIMIQTEHISGPFLIRALLMLPDGSRILAFTQRPVQFIQRPDILRITLAREHGGQVASIDPDAQLMNPNFPAAYTDRLFLRNVAVGSGPEFQIIHGNQVTASVEMKHESVVRNVTAATFVLVASHNTYTLNAVRSGNLFSARFVNFHSDVLLASGQRPHVELHYTYNGVNHVVRLGYLEIIVELDGTVYDTETMEPVEGATVTIYTLDGTVVGDPQITGSDGRFLLDLEDGLYDIRVDHPEYEFYLLSLYSGNGYLAIPPATRNGLTLLLNRVDSTEDLAVEVSESIEE
ncbi:MAG: carboxypeptidase-like regulatory domain-containing protein [Defluviitaleaceae bacterium]|nr:carboxypeptidase-like regulatory domain-containing protein [Defluviitaleaceae bacterium]